MLLKRELRDSSALQFIRGHLLFAMTDAEIILTNHA